MGIGTYGSRVSEYEECFHVRGSFDGEEHILDLTDQLGAFAERAGMAVLESSEFKSDHLIIARGEHYSLAVKGWGNDIGVRLYMDDVIQDVVELSKTGFADAFAINEFNRGAEAIGEDVQSLMQDMESYLVSALLDEGWEPCYAVDAYSSERYLPDDNFDLDAAASNLRAQSAAIESATLDDDIASGRITLLELISAAQSKSAHIGIVGLCPIIQDGELYMIPLGSEISPEEVKAIRLPDAIDSRLLKLKEDLSKRYPVGTHAFSGGDSEKLRPVLHDLAKRYYCDPGRFEAFLEETNGMHPISVNSAAPRIHDTFYILDYDTARNNYDLDNVVLAINSDTFVLENVDRHPYRWIDHCMELPESEMDNLLESGGVVIEGIGNLNTTALPDVTVQLDSGLRQSPGI